MISIIKIMITTMLTKKDNNSNYNDNYNDNNDTNNDNNDTTNDNNDSNICNNDINKSKIRKIDQILNVLPIKDKIER